MFFIPYGKVQIKTRISYEDAERRMKQQFTPLPKKTFLIYGYYHIKGNINNGRFTLEPHTGRGSYYSPIVSGEIRRWNRHSVVNITLRLSSFTLAVELFLLPAKIILPIYLLTVAWSEYTQYLNSQIGSHLHSALVALGMGFALLFFWYILPITEFNRRARIKLDILNNIFWEGNRFDLSRLE